jgi:hypothetical protein
MALADISCLCSSCSLSFDQLLFLSRLGSQTQTPLTLNLKKKAKLCTEKKETFGRP